MRKIRMSENWSSSGSSTDGPTAAWTWPLWTRTRTDGLEWRDERGGRRRMANYEIQSALLSLLLSNAARCGERSSKFYNDFAACIQIAAASVFSQIGCTRYWERERPFPQTQDQPDNPVVKFVSEKLQNQKKRFPF